MLELPWFYQFGVLHILLFVWAFLILVSTLGYIIGHRSRASADEMPKSTDLIPSNILGLLALIFGFSFSLAIARFENRRQLAIAEANAIGAAYIRAGALRELPIVKISDLYKKYVDSRISFYQSSDIESSLKKTAIIQKEIIEHFKILSQKERGALESSYSFTLTTMFDIANDRNFSLIKTLPVALYGIIILFASAALITINFDRGRRKEKDHWRPLVLVLLFGVMLAFIYDLDHPRQGSIKIGQDALIEQRKSM